MLFRYVTFKKNNCSDWYVDHIGYSSKLTYDYKVTNVKMSEPYNTYIINIDKSYDILDKQGNIIYDNDLIKAENKVFLVKKKQNRKTPIFINMDNLKESHTILYLNKVDWELIGNVYNLDTFNFNKL